ncbi:MAG: hypothetical protein J5I47_02945 [Vicingus serpentipes]|nr:hypothetical protein [Vicingus serpentipes]
MYYNYYVNTNAQSNGDHEVHKSGCNHMPEIWNQKFLGSFTNCKDAVKEAKKTYSTADGCYYCANECHNR